MIFIQGGFNKNFNKDDEFNQRRKSRKIYIKKVREEEWFDFLAKKN